MITMSRQPWTPETATDEQLRVRQAAIDAFAEATGALDRAWLLAGWAHDIGVPMEDLAERTTKSRATLFRNARKPTEAEREALSGQLIEPATPRRRSPAVAPLDVEESVDELVSEPFEDPA